jgi:hypothetical protein
MSLITLTQAQRDKVLKDMNETIEMLSNEEVEAIASKLNEEINIPFIKEGTEQTVFVKTVKLIDRLLYKNLPNELYVLVKDSTDGISDDEAENLEKILASRINKKFDIPYVPEWVEEEILKLTLSIIINAMRKNLSIIN